MHPLICGLLKIDASAVWDPWLGVADAESQHMYWSIPCYIEDLTHPRILVFMAADEGWILELIPLDTEGQLLSSGVCIEMNMVFGKKKKKKSAGQM